jgi:hypothetical protein
MNLVYTLSSDIYRLLPVVVVVLCTLVRLVFEVR